MYKGKVADEPDEWVCGELLPGNRIWQRRPHARSKCCGIGMFPVEPDSICEIAGNIQTEVERYAQNKSTSCANDAGVCTEGEERGDR